jgi:hypothetical protein
MITISSRYDETAIVNATVHQKDTLLEMIKSGEFSQWEMVLPYLRFCRELWATVRYSYKGKEIASILAAACGELITDTTHWKTKRKLENMAAEAFALADQFADDEALARMPKAA